MALDDGRDTNDVISRPVKRRASGFTLQFYWCVTFRLKFRLRKSVTGYDVCLASGTATSGSVAGTFKLFKTVQRIKSLGKSHHSIQPTRAQLYVSAQSQRPPADILRLRCAELSCYKWEMYQRLLGAFEFASRQKHRRAGQFLKK